jgi:hypothetical protein
MHLKNIEDLGTEKPEQIYLLKQGGDRGQTVITITAI